MFDYLALAHVPVAGVLAVMLTLILVGWGGLQDTVEQNSPRD